MISAVKSNRRSLTRCSGKYLFVDPLTLSDLLTRNPVLVLGVGRWTTWMAEFEIQNTEQGTRVEGVGMYVIVSSSSWSLNNDR